MVESGYLMRIVRAYGVGVAEERIRQGTELHTSIELVISRG